MGRSAAVLFLTLVLGACVAVNADGEWKDDYEKEPKAKECHLGKPLRWSTYGCPKCKTEDGCIETKCSNKYEGKADVKIKLSCLFGGKIGFVAMSYKDGDKDVCINNQKGYNKYDKEFNLYNLKCKELPKLRFIVQNKWWYNPKGKDLEIPDSCYDKCTHGKPCHTCEFKEIQIPECKNDNCKRPMCDTNKPYCPEKEKMDKCFDYDRSDEKYVKVTFKKECHKRMKHVACSYHDYADKNQEKSVEHKWSDNTDFSFKAACESSFKWFFEDDNYVNQYAPNYPLPGDGCWNYFQGGKICNRCGCKEPVYVGKCKE